MSLYHDWGNTANEAALDSILKEHITWMPVHDDELYNLKEPLRYINPFPRALNEWDIWNGKLLY